MVPFEQMLLICATVNFKWQQRRMVITFLEADSDTEDLTVRNKTVMELCIQKYNHPIL